MQCSAAIGATSWYQVARGCGLSSPVSGSVPQATAASANPRRNVRMGMVSAIGIPKISWWISTIVWEKPTNRISAFAALYSRGATADFARGLGGVWLVHNGQEG